MRANVLLPGGATDTGMIPDDIPDEIRTRLLDPAVMGPPIVWLASHEANDVHDQRIVATEFEDWLANDDPAKAPAMTATRPPTRAANAVLALRILDAALGAADYFAHRQLPLSAAAHDCFARRDAAELHDRFGDNPVVLIEPDPGHRRAARSTKNAAPPILRARGLAATANVSHSGPNWKVVGAARALGRHDQRPRIAAVSFSSRSRQARGDNTSPLNARRNRRKSISEGGSARKNERGSRSAPTGSRSTKMSLQRVHSGSTVG